MRANTDKFNHGIGQKLFFSAQDSAGKYDLHAIYLYSNYAVDRNYQTSCI